MRPSSTRDKIGWKQRRDPGPVKARKDQQTPSSAYGGLQPAIRIPPLEKQRQHLARTHDTSAFDKIIYRQEGSSQPPLGVAVPPEHSLQKRGNVFYGHINPRTHWTQQRSCEWHERKLTEIKGRGGRKANFGKAARRMKDQRLSENPKAWEENLPDRVRNDEAWLSAMRYHHNRGHRYQPNRTSRDGDKVSKITKKRTYRR
ncbi:hypothetical protein F5883DRAFT_526504 [Diaporthe sp. PMI_573]|nr:hypothetical protein F5883DRAFT_526504 [Diaporthaceae sp. PMI_573]